MARRPLGVWLCCALAGGTLLAAETEWSHEIDLETGFDSNPLRLPAHERGGGFMEAAFDGGLEVDLSDRSSFHADLEANARRFGSSLANADRTIGVLAAGVELTPYRNGRRRVVVDAGARLAVRRGTFTSRRTGEIARVDDGAGSLVPIPDRFDYDRTEGFVDVRWRVNRRTRLFVNTEYADKNYVEDYESLPTVEALDYDSLSITPGVRFKPSDLFDVELSATRTDREYATRMAVNAIGVSVPGTIREYEYTGLDAALRIRPGGGWRWTVGLGTVRREDPFAGYYDYTSWTAALATRVQVGAQNSVRLYMSSSDRDYDRSTVNNEVDAELRSRDTFRLKTAYTRELTRRFDVTVEIGLRSVDNADPDFDYDRNTLGVFVTYD